MLAGGQTEQSRTPCRERARRDTLNAQSLRELPIEAPVHQLSSSPPTAVESTATLLERVRGGDRMARENLVRRYLATLLRWGHGRLPVHARDLSDTQDIVQVTLLKALDHVGSFEPRREGAFLAYLRRIMLNAIREEIRRSTRRPSGEPISEELPAPRDFAVEQDTFDAYEKALATLPEDQQEAVILRVEFGYTHQEIADAVGSPSANAARMMVARALVRLAEAMGGPL